MANIYDTLHPKSNPSDNLYPNIQAKNIPNKSIDTNKLSNNVLSLIGSLKPSGVDTSVNILAFSTNKGIWIGSDTGDWYYWDGTQYVSGGTYQSTSISDGSVTYSKLSSDVTDILDTYSDNIKNLNEYMTRDVWDLIDENYWTFGGVATDVGNTVNNQRLRTPHCLYLHPDDFIIFDSLDDDVFFQVREYAGGLSNVSGVPSDYNEGNIHHKIYKPQYTCIRIVIVADGTGYTTISSILSKVSIKIVHSNYDLERNKFKGISQDISDFYLEDGGLTTSADKTQWGLNFSPSVDYANATKRINYKIAVNPNETIRIISTKDNIFIKIWGYTQVTLSNNASADTWTSLTQDAQITGYPYIRFVVYSRDPVTRSLIAITDLSDVKQHIYFIHIANSGDVYNYPSKIRVCSYNIGHYSNGQSSSSTSTADDLPNYYQAFGELKCDILLAEEDNGHWFDANGTIDLRASLYSNFFKYYYGGTQYTYNCNSICSNYPLQKSEETIYADYNQTRYYLDTVVNIDGKNVHFITTHLDFSSQVLRQKQINELITLVKNYEYFVIGGDFNTADNGYNTGDVDYALFTSEGFNIANYGMFGIFYTATSSITGEGLAIDNIITSANIKIAHVETLTQDVSDHLPIIADLIIM